MSLPLSRSPYDDLLAACAPVLRPALLVTTDDGRHARLGATTPAPLIDASRPAGEPAVLTIRSFGGPVGDCPLAGFLNG